jgi:DNA uptake lipoprotein
MLAILLLQLSVSLLRAQSSAPQSPDIQDVTCTTANERRVERIFKRRSEGRMRSHSLAEAEEVLRTLIQSCPKSSRRTEFQKKLETVEEESAEFHLGVANFYLHADGRGLVQGALSRLKRIYDGYPHYSRRDLVLYMLGDLNQSVGDTEAAEKYYRSLTTEFPDSKYAERAKQWLKERQPRDE